jgi:hypothetical protein
MDHATNVTNPVVDSRVSQAAGRSSRSLAKNLNGIPMGTMAKKM